MKSDHYQLGGLLRGSLIGLTLLGCQASTVPPDATPVPPPPELDIDTLSLPDNEQPVSTEDLSISAAAQQPLTSQSQRAFLPGLSAPNPPEAPVDEQSVATEGETELPFENELQKQQKRIELGLEREDREEEPVDNVVNLKF